MDSDKIVCLPNVKRYYRDNPQLIKKYREIAKKKKCPFCQRNIRNEGFSFVAETNDWWAIKNSYPYKNSALHLLIIPKRHVISLNALYPEEWNQMAKVIGIVFGKYPFLAKGYGLAIRDGKVGGVTLFHLHFHLIAPKVELITGQIAVNFGIG